MKIILIALIAINFCCSGQRIPNPTIIKSDHIRIDHIGQNDKPFPSLVITTTHLNLQIEEWEVLVSNEVFSNVQMEITTTALLKDSMLENKEYGTFRIALFNDAKKTEYFLCKRNDSIEFLEKLKANNLNKESAKQLIIQIDYLNSRIDIGGR